MKKNLFIVLLVLTAFLMPKMHRNSNGFWSQPQKINNMIHFDGNARFPSISPDGRYLFFCGDDGNIYWVNINAITGVSLTFHKK